MKENGAISLNSDLGFNRKMVFSSEMSVWWVMFLREKMIRWRKNMFIGLRKKKNCIHLIHLVKKVNKSTHLKI